MSNATKSKAKNQVENGEKRVSDNLFKRAGADVAAGRLTQNKLMPEPCSTAQFPDFGSNESDMAELLINKFTHLGSAGFFGCKLLHR